jgi:hypothetical protein
MHSYHSDVTSTNHASATQLVLTLNYVSLLVKVIIIIIITLLSALSFISLSEQQPRIESATLQSAISCRAYGAKIMLSANKRYDSYVERLRDLRRPLITTQLY